MPANRRHSQKRSGGSRIDHIIIAEIIILALILGTALFFIIRDRKGASPAPAQSTEAPSETPAASDAPSESGTEPAETESETQTEVQPSFTPSNVNDGQPVQNVDPRTPANFEVAPAFERTLMPTGDDLLDEANRQAAMYDYDAAIALLQASPNASSEAYQNAIKEYETKKSQLVRWSDMASITHIFFHTLVVDVDTAFTCDKRRDYNDVMTTVDEFCKIMQLMYDEGYVIVSLYDVAKMVPQPDGTEIMTFQDIMLPPGKKPFILSQDDVSYYEYMTGQGFASRFVIDEETGKVINEMDLADGTVLRGSYDMVPILEDFLEAHPDFCYRGARGTLALTGYDGIFGYRTSDFWYVDGCPYYISNERNDYEKAHSHTSPNLNIEQDKVTASQIAQRLKEMGWTFASHGWGHVGLGTTSEEHLVWDIDMWKKEVEPLLGDVDIMIYPKGEDIHNWHEYPADNYRYQVLKERGFDYFCNVDSNIYWIQRTNNYYRMGRRNFDGRRFWMAYLHPDSDYPKLISDIIPDINAVIDLRRCPWEE